MHLGYHSTEGPAQACTGPNNNVQSCPYLFRLKRDMRCTSVTIEVVLPSAFSNFLNGHSGVMCTVQCSMCLHNGRLAALFPEVTHEELLQKELKYTVGFDPEEIQLSLISPWEKFVAYR